MFTKFIDQSKTLFKFSLISLLSFVIDFFIFTGLNALFGGLFFPLITARLISGGFNFWQNKLLVYKAQRTGRIKKEIISYILLAVIVFVAGYFLISFFVLQLHVNIILAKVIIDAILFFSNYLFQKHLIFFQR